MRSGPCDADPHKEQEDTADQCNNYRRVYSCGNLILPPASDQAGDDDIGAQGNAYEQIDQQSDDRRVAADRSHRLFADELADDRHVRRIEQLLQDAGKRKRQRKEKDLIA